MKHPNQVKTYLYNTSVYDQIPAELRTLSSASAVLYCLVPNSKCEHANMYNYHYEYAKHYTCWASHDQVFLNENWSNFLSVNLLFILSTLTGLKICFQWQFPPPKKKYKQSKKKSDMKILSSSPLYWPRRAQHVWDMNCWALLCCSGFSCHVKRWYHI